MVHVMMSDDDNVDDGGDSGDGDARVILAILNRYCRQDYSLTELFCPF